MMLVGMFTERRGWVCDVSVVIYPDFMGIISAASADFDMGIPHQTLVGYVIVGASACPGQ